MTAPLVALLAAVVPAPPAAASETSAELVYLVDSDGDGATGVVLRDLATRTATTVLREADAYDSEPELSPDGTELVLATDRGSEDGAIGIAVVGRDGEGLRRLTSPTSGETTTTVDIQPSWFPDGQRVLFTRATLDDATGRLLSADLYVVARDGLTPPAALPGGEGALSGDVRPDGRFAAVVLHDPRVPDGEGGLAVVDLVVGQRQTLPARGYDPAWHPTRHLIAYATVTHRDPDPDRAEHGTALATIGYPSGQRQAFIHSTRARGDVRLFNARPEWLPDGESLVYHQLTSNSLGEPQPADLWVADASSRRAGRWTTTGALHEHDAHAHGPAPSAVTSGEAAGYTPVEPVRVLDTREGVGTDGVTTKVGPGDAVTLRLRGTQTSAGPVPDDASAVVLNVTATEPDAGTDIRVYPTGGEPPTVSNVNVPRGRTIPNLVTVTLGEDGAVRLRNNSGRVHLIADLAGFYRPGQGLSYRPVHPARIFDTRDGTGTAAGRVPGGRYRDVAVTGTLRTTDGTTTEIPTTARAVVLNVTATGVTRSTDVRVYPTRTGSTTVPEISNLNLIAGETAANLVTVPVGDGGRVRIRNNSGEAHLIADIAGYYTESTTQASRFVPVAPLRFLDTREGLGAAPLRTGAAQYVDLRVGDTRGVPLNATAAVLNLTATGPTAATDIRAFPYGMNVDEPTVSNLNLPRGATRANLAVVRLGTNSSFTSQGWLLLRNNSGTVHLIADLAGYFVPAE